MVEQLNGNEVDPWFLTEHPELLGKKAALSVPAARRRSDFKENRPSSSGVLLRAEIGSASASSIVEATHPTKEVERDMIAELEAWKAQKAATKGR